MKAKMHGFTVRNWKAKLAAFPTEDLYNYDENGKIACVADGVTRDFLDGTAAIKHPKNLIKFWGGMYPSYARDRELTRDTAQLWQQFVLNCEGYQTFFDKGIEIDQMGFDNEKLMAALEVLVKPGTLE